MKKFLSLLLVMTMLLTAFPMATVTMAETTATTDVKLFDAHITGNLVIGGTLTANFEPADADAAEECGYSLEETIKTIKWQARDRYGTGHSSHYLKSYLATGTTTYTIPENWKAKTDTLTTTIIPSTSNPYNIFFQVTPMNSKGEKIGETVYSYLTTAPGTIDASKDNVPAAVNSYIAPLNGNGDIEVGSTVAARFSFQYLESKDVNESGSLYKWFTSDKLLTTSSDVEAAECVQEESTNPKYVIKQDDFGKWIYVKITPIASDGTKGTEVYTRNHTGNALLKTGASASASSSTGFYSSSSTSQVYSSYPTAKLLADGVNTEGNSGTFLLINTSSNTTTRSITLNFGKSISFDTVYFRHRNLYLKNFVLSYSNDNVNYTDIINDSAAQYGAGSREFDCGNVVTAQYLKFSGITTTASNTLTVDEFYPFLKTVVVEPTATIDFTKSSFAQLNEDKIEVQAWGTPLAEVKKAENGFKVVSTLDAEGSTTNADAIANNVKFVTKNGDSYTEIADVDNIKVTENLKNTYLKVDDGKVIQYYLVEYAGNIYTKEDEVVNSAVGSTSSTSNNARYIIGENGTLKLDDEGNTIGKYLLKTKINIPDGARTVIYAKQGGAKATGANLNNILMLNGYSYTKYTDDNYYLGHQIAVPSLVKQTDFGFDRDEWLDLEMLFDYDSTSSGELSTINIKAWVDGVLVSDDNHPWTNPVGISTASASLLSPYIIMWPNNNTVKIQYKNSSFRQVWSADTHVVENDYDLMIVNSDAADVEATTLAAGSYTANTNMNVYKGSDLVTYIAKYYVNGDTKELMDVAYALSATKNYVTVTEDELANNSVELKAITFSYLTDSLYPQFVSKSLKSN